MHLNEDPFFEPGFALNLKKEELKRKRDLHEIKQRTENLKVALKADGRPYVMPDRIVQKVALEPITEP